MKTFAINPEQNWSLDNLREILEGQLPIVLDEKAKENIKKSRTYLDHQIAGDKIFYGINTGFGDLCNVQVAKHELEELQYNLVRSHACGAGSEVPDRIVKLMILLKIRSLSFGYSGIQESTINRLIDFYNHDIYPVIYTHGSLGASGDLAPLAHLSLPLFGEGKVKLKGKAMASSEMHRMMAWEPIQLKSKEGLALLNGTQFMLAYGLDAMLRAEKLMDQANINAALSIDAWNCKHDFLFPSLHKIRNQSGQIEIAAKISSLLQGSTLVHLDKPQVQDPYSFRCVPQVHGATLDAIRHICMIFERELNGVTDNPNIFPDEDRIVSGGNFHGQPLAIHLDFLKIAMAELGNISERRIFKLMSGTRGLPPFLTQKSGLQSGLMILQYAAASMVSDNKQKCTPASVDSITSSNGQEDHVSMGANAAVQCKELLDHLEEILAIEWFTATQAMEFRRPEKTGAALEVKFREYRKVIPFEDRDRIFSDIMRKSREFLFNPMIHHDSQ